MLGTSNQLLSKLSWRHRPWGRIFIGLLLAQGLFYALCHLLTAFLMGVEGREAVEQMWTAASGIRLLQSVRMFSVIVGAVFAGAGQRQARSKRLPRPLTPLRSLPGSEGKRVISRFPSIGRLPRVDRDGVRSLGSANRDRPVEDTEV
jgi:hypothetical protein